MDIDTITQVVTCLSLIAASLKSGFSKFYTQIIPDLKRIIEHVKTDDLKKVDVRVLTIETMGFFLSAIKENT